MEHVGRHPLELRYSERLLEAVSNIENINKGSLVASGRSHISMENSSEATEKADRVTAKMTVLLQDPALDSSASIRVSKTMLMRATVRWLNDGLIDENRFMNLYDIYSSSTDKQIR